MHSQQQWHSRPVTTHTHTEMSAQWVVFQACGHAHACPHTHSSSGTSGLTCTLIRLHYGLSIRPMTTHIRVRQTMGCTPEAHELMLTKRSTLNKCSAFFTPNKHLMPLEIGAF